MRTESQRLAELIIRRVKSEWGLEEAANISIEEREPYKHYHEVDYEAGAWDIATKIADRIRQLATKEKQDD